MHLLFISTMEGVPWGGSEELWSQAALRLAREGHRVSASVRTWSRPVPRIAELRAQGVHVRERRPFAESRAQRLWLRLISDNEENWLRKAKPDLVIISQGDNMEGLEWMQFCRRENLPYSCVVQCNAEIWWPADDKRPHLAEAYAAARKTFCVSRHNLELLQRQIGVDLPRARVVCNPYRLPNPPDYWPATETWKMACVARLEPWNKGQDFLLQVLARPQWRERPVQIEFHGSGRGAEGLQDLARQLQLKNVRFCGQTPDIAGIWKENHLLLLPSRIEGMPLALIEAMWCRRPAVVTDVGGNAECCLDGQTGFLAAAPTVALLEEAMERAWARREEWQTLGESAHQRTHKILPENPVGLFCREILQVLSS
jgi:glycosyltransferase involved in cell wall biosynthesis